MTKGNKKNVQIQYTQTLAVKHPERRYSYVESRMKCWQTRGQIKGGEYLKHFNRQKGEARREAETEAKEHSNTRTSISGAGSGIWVEGSPETD